MIYLLGQMEEKMPSEVIPWTNRYLRLIRDSYSLSAGQLTLDSLLTQNYPENDLQIVAENLYRLRLLDDAGSIFEKIYESNANNVQALSILIDIFDRTNKYEKGVEYLRRWLESHPADPQQVKFNIFEM
jgi:lipopolysaccharide biosynthesis regulator YciM